MFIGLRSAASGGPRARYFETDGFRSETGFHVAEQIRGALAARVSDAARGIWSGGPTRMLRETQMAAVVCELMPDGDADALAALVRRSGAVGAQSSCEGIRLAYAASRAESSPCRKSLLPAINCCSNYRRYSVVTAIYFLGERAVDPLEILESGEVDGDPAPARGVHRDLDPGLEVVAEQLLELDDPGRALTTARGARTAAPRSGRGLGLVVVSADRLFDRPHRQVFLGI